MWTDTWQTLRRPNRDGEMLERSGNHWMLYGRTDYHKYRDGEGLHFAVV